MNDITYMYNRRTGMPYQIINCDDELNVVIREMAVLKVTDGLFDGLTHPWGTIVTDVQNVMWHISEDLTKNPITVHPIARNVLYEDENEIQFNVTDTPIVFGCL